MKYILGISALLFTALIIWVIIKLASLPFFLGLIVGFVLTVFLSIFTLKYIEIEEKRKKRANAESIYQDNHREPDTDYPIHQGSDIVGGEQENNKDEDREQSVSNSSGVVND